MNLVDQFQKTRVCPKCQNRYFNIEINWMNSFVKSVYTCDSCAWSFTTNCTSPASSPGLSSQYPSKVCERPVQIK
jgi:transposase-like protein